MGETNHPSVEPPQRPPTNLRQHHQRTERNMILGGFIILFVVGGGLIWLLYGVEAMFAGWLCLGSGVALYGLLALILKLIESLSDPGRGKE